MQTFYISPEDYAEAAKNGISETILYQRVYVYGWDVKRAVTTPLARRNAWGWTEWKDVALQNKVSYRTYLDRVKDGWTFEAAASTPTLSRKEVLEVAAKSRKFVFTPEQIEEAKRNGVTPRNAWRRVKVLGWSIDDAVSTPLVSLEESLQRAKKNNPFRKQTDDYWALIRAKKGAVLNV